MSATQEIKDLWQEYAAAASAGDLERWLALWVEDGIQCPPNAIRRVGKETIRTEMQPLFDLFNTQMAVHPDGIVVLGDRAYAHGLYEFVMTPKEGGDSLEVKGKFLTILRQQANGGWQIAIDCFNYDAPV